MFTPPPYPPKDYVLSSVPKVQRDSPQFTPDSLPRVTQTTFGYYCSPIEYQPGETPEKIEVQTVNPYIINKWTKEAKAFWVDKPGKDDFFLHDVYKKYSVKMDTYDPRWRHMEKVFNRSYKYELDCLEEFRLQKLRDKCQKESKAFECNHQNQSQEDEEKHSPIKVDGCEHHPPFWWKDSTNSDPQDAGSTRESCVENHKNAKEDKAGGTFEKFAFGRWAEEPNLTAVVVDDPCRRKFDMHKVGQPFKNEACNFYYNNYPPPDIKFRPKKM